MISWAVTDQYHPAPMTLIRDHPGKISGWAPADVVRDTPDLHPEQNLSRRHDLRRPRRPTQPATAKLEHPWAPRHTQGYKIQVGRAASCGRGCLPGTWRRRRTRN